MQKGLVDGVLAYIIFGLYPLYWKLLADVPSMQLLAHRVVWSIPLVLVVIAVTGQFAALLEAARHWRLLVIYTVSGLLMGTNLFVSVWAVNAGFIVEMSLGYFINPVVSVLLGVVFLREKLRLCQWLSVALAIVGVGVVTFGYGKFPYIAFTIAFAFGFYGLVQKEAPLSPVQGVTIEMSILAVPCLVYLLVCEAQGNGSFGRSSVGLTWLLVGCGPMTVVPQLLFCSSVQSIPLSLLGILQFIGPTMNIVIGICVYDEDFSGAKMVGFILVWVSLVFFTAESFYFVSKNSNTSIDSDTKLEAGDADFHQADDLTN
ncbi:protein RarD [Aphanomyces invadans]|uniref:Protein RarD n=1 Tax=Aphanomyces invadans TaxID=157072 RepID=A0A024U947_9STRA|nr:protein RarD [Aphanomyces invadans]ETW02804.1 protein RarD [Aphanomyces invadans]RHY31870.1 hypothetical protein DYB32_003089 [Aphanomyces invadans]|eukprot:XP_008868188.1 protein RarD [Aphanomyces invadans]